MNDLATLQANVAMWMAPQDPTAYQQWWANLPEDKKPVFAADVKALQDATAQAQATPQAPVPSAPVAPTAVPSTPPANAFVPSTPPAGTALAPAPTPGALVAGAKPTGARAMTAGISTGMPVITVKNGQFTIPALNGIEAVQVMDMIILGVSPSAQKIYFEGAYTGTGGDGRPPRCQSPDGVKPFSTISNPISPTCADCPMNKFESALQGKGKACSDKRAMAIVSADHPGQKLFKIMIPPSGLRPLAEYGQYLLDQGVEPEAVVTRFSFVEGKRKFLHVKFEVVSLLTPEQTEAVKQQMSTGNVERFLTPYEPREDDDDESTQATPPVAPVPSAPTTPVAPVPPAPTSPMLSHVPTTAPQFPVFKGATPVVAGQQPMIPTPPLPMATPPVFPPRT